MKRNLVVPLTDLPPWTSRGSIGPDSVSVSEHGALPHPPPLIARPEDLPLGPACIVFGAGRGGQLVNAALQRSGRAVRAFLDNHADGPCCGLPVLRPDAFAANPDAAEITVVLASQYWALMLEQLRALGIPRIANAWPLVRTLAANDADDRTVSQARGVAEYGNWYNVTDHETFGSEKDSLEFLDWRNGLYYGLEQYMPTSGCEGLTVLDYGCGPGHDLVGFWCNGRPSRLIAVDIAPLSLAEARHRLSLHGGADPAIMWLEHDAQSAPLPIADGSIDVINCSGVLHHLADPGAVLREFRRLLAPGGHAQVMVYNQNSVFFHLTVAWQQAIMNRDFAGQSLHEVFRQLTDGPGCPISRCYRPQTFLDIAEEAGLCGKLVGCAVHVAEMAALPRRFGALMDRRLGAESRQFLRSLSFDEWGLPHHGGIHAGIDACFRLVPA